MTEVTIDQMKEPVAPWTHGMDAMQLFWKGSTTFTKEQFDRLQKTVFKDVIYLRETNPGQFHIEEGHGVIGQAMSDKVNLVPVWFHKRSGTVEKFNLNLTTYQLEPLEKANGNSN